MFSNLTLPLLLFTIISISTAWDVTSSSDKGRQCAQIYFQPRYKEPSLPLNDDEQFSDLTDIQFYMDKQLGKSNQIEQEEEGTDSDVESAPQGGLSFRIREDCTLKLASQTFLKGEKHEFSGDVESLPDDWLVPKSAACECLKECKCEDNKLRQSECGRAYLHDDCTNCKALFTSLKPGGGWERFPEKWASNVQTIMLRDGCEVSLESAGKNGKSQIHKLSSESSTVIKGIADYGSIKRYQCMCTEGVHHTAEEESDTGNPNYPPLVDIPKSKGKINTLLFREELKNHPGLMASLQSLRNKRNPKNAYILLLGMTGSGKSTAVNLLFDHPNITKTGDFVSTTSDIIHFTIPVPVKELGMNNTALHVIDTPGFGDTRGIAEDSRFLASLDDFLKRNEDLRGSLPNVVLIFSKFSDNRFRGEGASFVKMLRTIDLFKDKIIDKKSTNVIFVLTHYMSETSQMTRDPRQRVNSIREVIQQFSSLPRPIHIVLAENKPEEAHLPSINGFYRLPNGEFYPKNLFDQMQRNLVDNGDPVGEAIIRTAFSNSDNFEITGKRHRLLHTSNSKVTKYLGLLGSFNKRIAETEVSTELQKAYEQLDPRLKTGYPDILQILQNALFIRNFLHKSDLPQTSIDMLRLLKEVPLNPASIFLLRSALNVTVPAYEKALVVGSGYSLIKDETLPAKLFEVEYNSEEPSDILFRIPDMYNVVLENGLENQIQVFKTRDDFIRARMSTLGLSEDAIPLDSYESSLSDHPGFNLVSLTEGSESDPDSPQISWSALTAAVDYHTFQIGLSTGAKFSAEFTSVLEALQPLNLTDPESVKSWRLFFDRYGTHVVTQAYGGGSVTIKTEVDEGETGPLSNTDKFALLSETMANIMQQLANELIGKVSAYEPPSGTKYQFSQVGGDYKHFWSNFSELDETRNIDDWKESLQFEPAVLKTRLQLLPISEVVSEITGDRDLSYRIEEAAATLLNASLVYIPMQRVYDSEGNPMSRDRMDGMGQSSSGDYESMQEFANMFKTISETNKETQAQLIALMAESKRKQQADEEKYQQEMIQLAQQRAEEARMRREDERYDKELQLKREEMEMQRMAQENAVRAQMEQARLQAEMQQRVMMEEIRSKNEQSMLSFINMENERRKEIALKKKGTLDKIFEFASSTFGSVAQYVGAALPIAAMAG